MSGLSTSLGFLLVSLLLLAFVEGAAKIPGDGCLRPPPELEQQNAARMRARRQLRLNSTDPNLMSMTNLPYFSEIVDPLDPCYKYICYPMPRASPFYAWVKRFNQDRCCRFEDQHISIGDFRTLEAGLISEVMDDGASSEMYASCSQKIVRCKLPEFPHDPPETVVEVLPNSRCCLHEGRMIPPGEVVMDPERCAVISCNEATAGLDFPGNKDLQITKIFEHACGCCVFEGRMVKDGDWLVSNGQVLNVTCMKGRLYHIEEMPIDGNQEAAAGLGYDDKETVDAGGLLNLDLPWREPLTLEDGNRCNSMCDPDKKLEPFLEMVRSLLVTLQVEKIGLVLEQHNSYLNLVAQTLLASVSPGSTSSTQFQTYVTYYSRYCTNPASSSGYSSGSSTGYSSGSSSGSTCYFAYSVDGLQGHAADCMLFNSWIKLLLRRDEEHEMKDWRLGATKMGLSNVMANIRGSNESEIGTADQAALVVVFTDVPDVNSLEQLLLHLPTDQIRKVTADGRTTVAAINVNDNQLLMGILKDEASGKPASASTITVGNKANIEDYYGCLLKCKCFQDKSQVFQNQMRTFRAYRGQVKLHRSHGERNGDLPFVTEDLSMSFRKAVIQGGVCPANSLKNLQGVIGRKMVNFANPKDLRYNGAAVGPLREVGDIMVPSHMRTAAFSGMVAPSGLTDNLQGRIYQNGQTEEPQVMTLADREKIIGPEATYGNMGKGSGFAGLRTEVNMAGSQGFLSNPSLYEQQVVSGPVTSMQDHVQGVGAMYEASGQSLGQMGHNQDFSVTSYEKNENYRTPFGNSRFGTGMIGHDTRHQRDSDLLASGDDSVEETSEGASSEEEPIIDEHPTYPSPPDSEMVIAASEQHEEEEASGAFSGLLGTEA